MFHGLTMFLNELWSFLLNPWTIFNVLWATQLGIIVGMLPGLTATMGIALLVTLTFQMASQDAILILICMYTEIWGRAVETMAGVFNLRI